MAAVCNRAGLFRPELSHWQLPVLGPPPVLANGTGQGSLPSIFLTPSAMVRIDMSEYMEKPRLLVWLERSGICGLRRGRPLIEAVRRKPYSVSLLDEVERLIPMCSISCFGFWTMVASPMARAAW